MSPFAVFGAVLSALSFPVLTAQQGKPRFVLPEVPYDYAPRAAAGLERHFSLPTRNGGSPRRGCGPAQPFGPELPDRLNELATLGRVLFHDPLLSRNESRSCASCHEQARAFADGKVQSRGFHGRLTARNAMSIANLGLLREGLFWDGRAKTLEAMVVMPIQDAVEMGLDLDTLVARLRVEPGYAELFAQAFGEPGIDRDRIARSLAQFVRSIVSLQSRYDEGLAATGDFDADFPGFTAAENRGKKLFFGEPATRGQSCAMCHAGHEYGWCSHSFSFDPVALQSDACSNNGVDSGQKRDDPGAAGVTGKSEDRGAFRAPSLRNVELTGPYMHDGRFATLEEVVHFYANGVRLHPNLHPVLRDEPGKARWGGRAPASSDFAMHASPATRLGVPMTARDRADLVAFLKTLTDHELLRDPRFSDPFVRRAHRGRRP